MKMDSLGVLISAPDIPTPDYIHQIITWINKIELTCTFFQSITFVSTESIEYNIKSSSNDGVMKVFVVIFFPFLIWKVKIKN